MFPAGQPITVIARVLTHDTDNNDIYVDGPSVTVLGAYNPGGSTELVRGQDQVVTQPTVYLPYSTVVGPYDQIGVAGQRFDVDGSPNYWTNPFTGWQAGCEVKLKAVTG